MNEPKETTKICGTCQGFGGYPRCPECMNARTAKSEPSEITKQIVEEMIERDLISVSKYKGKTMDRSDLSPSEWAQHYIEEMIDGLKYIKRVKGALDLLGRAKSTMEALAMEFPDGSSAKWMADYNRQFGK